MNPNDSLRGATACPSLGALTAYRAGKLSPAEMAAVAAHTSGCSCCGHHLRRYPADGDSLVADLRRAKILWAHLPPIEPGTTPPAKPPRADEPPRFSGYEVVAKIGQGGMSVVYQAIQLCPRRTVAIKTPLPDGLQADPWQGRMQTEGHATARLEHENIVRVYEYGEDNGRPFIAMEFVEGEALAQRLAAGALPERDAAAMVRTLARAVQFAHDRHVVHRDLKPANVLLTRTGQLKLTDFGLARLLDLTSRHTEEQTLLGTACYMSPEQARGDARALGKLTDVYGLGAVLYETLTGRPPFRAATPLDTRAQVLHAPLPLPSQFRPRLSPRLEAVCLKCLQKDPTRRYESAGAVAAALAPGANWLTRAWVRVCRRFTGASGP